MSDEFALGSSKGCTQPTTSAQPQEKKQQHRMLYGVSRDDYLTAFAADKKRLKLEKSSKDGKRKETSAPALDRMPMPNLPESVKMEYRASMKDAQQRKVYFNQGFHLY